MIVFAFPADLPLASRLGGDCVPVDLHTFPDGETRVRLDAPVRGRDVVVVCSLDRPNPKLAPLAFALQAARDGGAARVRLVAPYLAYLRQDRAFHRGEAVAARTFGRLLSSVCDGVVTVDPHLHRLHALSDAFSVPGLVVHAAPPLAGWIAREVERPLIVGPDEESGQWAADVADRCGAPWTTLRKTRRGDRDVEVTVPDLARHPGRTPVLVDDIVSSGRTLAAAAAHLVAAGAPPPTCIVVHGLFAEGAVDALTAAGVARVVTANTVPHPTNAIDVAPLLAEALR